MDKQEIEQGQVAAAPVTRPSSWPKTLGIIAMVFGVLGALSSLTAILSSFFPGFLAKMSQLPPDFYDKWSFYLLSSGLATLFLGALLFFGGLFLTLRKPLASKMISSWAVLKMVLGVVGNYFAYQMQQEQIPLMLENQKKLMEKASPEAAAQAEQMVGMVSGITEIATVVGMVLGMAWLMVLPVFMLIWFIRPKIRKEMVGWGQGGD